MGRSADRMFDLLGGALSGTSWRDRIHQLPLSLFRGDGAVLSADETRQLRANLTAAGSAPYDLMRGPTAVFADLVAAGSPEEPSAAERWSRDLCTELRKP